MYQNERIQILHIPIDLLEEEKLEETVRALLDEENSSQICFIGYSDIIRAMFNREYMDCLRASRLNIPISPAVSFAASYLNLRKPSIYNPYTFVIRLLGVLEKTGKSLYILGSRKKNILKSESNLRTSFPGLQIVGRYAGSFTAQEEKDILMAVRKSSPSLLLTGKGLKGNNLWLHRNRRELSQGIHLWGRTCFEVFSGKKSKPGNSTKGKLIAKGFLSLLFPWLLLRHILFFLMLTIEKIRMR